MRLAKAHIIMANKPASNVPADGDITKTQVADLPIADLLDKYREHITNAHTIAGVLMGKHRFTKEQLPKPPKSQSFKLVTAELTDKVKEALEGRTVTANKLDEFLFRNGIKPYSKTGIARKELKSAGVIEVKENAVGTATYIWLARETMKVPTGADMGATEGE
jgi:hypothetical protein